MIPYFLKIYIKLPLQFLSNLSQNFAEIFLKSIQICSSIFIKLFQTFIISFQIFLNFFEISGKYLKVSWEFFGKFLKNCYEKDFKISLYWFMFPKNLSKISLKFLSHFSKILPKFSWSNFRFVLIFSEKLLQTFANFPKFTKIFVEYLKVPLKLFRQFSQKLLLKNI